MPKQKVFTIQCPSLGCHDYAVLPRQSLLGIFEDRPYPFTDAWPINYLCKRCERVSVHPVEAIHPEDVEMLGQGLLVQYVFSNVQLDSLTRLWIYSKESELYTPEYETVGGAIKRILIPSALWKESYGYAKNVLVDTFRQEVVNLSL